MLYLYQINEWLEGKNKEDDDGVGAHLGCTRRSMHA